MFLVDEHSESLGHQRRQRQRAELAAHAGPLPAFAAHDYEGSLGSQSPPEPRQTAVPTGVEDQVVAPGAVGEVLPGVVDDVVGADRADEFDFRGAAHTRDLCSEGLASCTA